MAKKDAKNDEEETEEGGGKKKLPMIIGAVLVLGAAYQFVLKPAPEEPAPDAMAMVEEEEIVEGEILELPEMVINIQDDEVQYMRVGIALVLEEGTMAADFEAESAIAKDVILDDLSARTAAELRSSAGKTAVKEEISAKIRAAYDDEKVVRILFTALVMQ